MSRLKKTCEHATVERPYLDPNCWQCNAEHGANLERARIVAEARKEAREYGCEPRMSADAAMALNRLADRIEKETP